MYLLFSLVIYIIHELSGFMLSVFIFVSMYSFTKEGRSKSRVGILVYFTLLHDTYLIFFF